MTLQELIDGLIKIRDKYPEAAETEVNVYVDQNQDWCTDGYAEYPLENVTYDKDWRATRLS